MSPVLLRRFWGEIFRIPTHPPPPSSWMARNPSPITTRKGASVQSAETARKSLFPRPRWQWPQVRKGKCRKSGLTFLLRKKSVAKKKSGIFDHEYDKEDDGLDAESLAMPKSDEESNRTKDSNKVRGDIHIQV